MKFLSRLGLALALALTLTASAFASGIPIDIKVQTSLPVPAKAAVPAVPGKAAISGVGAQSSMVLGGLTPECKALKASNPGHGWLRSGGYCDLARNLQTAAVPQGRAAVDGVAAIPGSAAVAAIPAQCTQTFLSLGDGVHQHAGAC